ncbi:hypothetical protein SLE2022_340380 [Rubroshorea leprosula]
MVVLLENKEKNFSVGEREKNTGVISTIQIWVKNPIWVWENGNLLKTWKMDSTGRNIGGKDGGSFGLGQCWCSVLIGPRSIVIEVREVKIVRSRGCTGELGRLKGKRYGRNKGGVVEEVEG